MKELSFRTRQDNLARFGEEIFDLIILGGGITGAGIAWDATLRGLKVALLEKGDFAGGTSSRSSQLIHGGFRYLKTLQFRLVFESCAERHLLRRLAPGLIRPLPFLFPVYGDSPYGYRKLMAGMWLYELLALFKNDKFHRMLDRPEALKTVPGLREEGLRGGALYYDCLTDDARLTLEVIKAAARREALVANYVEAVGLLKTGGKVCGVAARDQLDRRELEIKGKAVINATGVWLDRIRRLDDPSCPELIRPTKGAHLLLPGGCIGGRVAVVGTAIKDRRPFFVLPWHDRTLVGTTDTDYPGNFESPTVEVGGARPHPTDTDYPGNFDCPKVDGKDVAYLLESLKQLFPEAGLSESDVLSTYAGLRPLIRAGRVTASEVPRDQAVLESASGLISVGGGKLTLFRRMAREVVDLAIKRIGRLLVLPLETKAYFTDRVPLREESLGPETEMNAHLEESYGPQGSQEVLEIAREQPELKEQLIDDLPQIWAEVLYGVRYEMALTLGDVLVRRLRVSLVDKDQGLKSAEEVVRVMGMELGWSKERQQEELRAYRKALRTSPV